MSNDKTLGMTKINSYLSVGFDSRLQYKIVGEDRLFITDEKRHEIHEYLKMSVEYKSKKITTAGVELTIEEAKVLIDYLEGL